MLDGVARDAVGPARSDLRRVGAFTMFSFDDTGVFRARQVVTFDGGA